MRVFISWSGERSRCIGELLDNWLQCVLQAIDPWMSSKDIDRGSLWFTEINDQLRDTSIGIICLTQDNKEKPWILFEAGALAKGLTSSRVCTFLIDLQSTDLGDPLAQFNHTFPTKDSMWSLVRTLNNALLEHALKDKVLEKVFDTYWPQFESEFEHILEQYPQHEKQLPKRKNDDILLDILSLARSLDKRVRSIEISSDSSKPDILFDKNSNLIPPKSYVDKQITDMLNAGLTTSEIINEIRKFGVSADYALRKISNNKHINSLQLSLIDDNTNTNG